MTTHPQETTAPVDRDSMAAFSEAFAIFARYNEKPCFYGNDCQIDVMIDPATVSDEDVQRLVSLGWFAEDLGPQRGFSHGAWDA